MALPHDEFFSKLQQLFTEKHSKSHGSVFLTQKKMPSNPSTSTSTTRDSLADLESTETGPILIRATGGKSKKHPKDRVKISTLVKPDEIDAFFTRYTETCRAGMQALKKRDRSKSKKKEKSKKKKTAAGGGE